MSAPVLYFLSVSPKLRKIMNFCIKTHNKETNVYILQHKTVLYALGEQLRYFLNILLK